MLRAATFAAVFGVACGVSIDSNGGSVTVSVDQTGSLYVQPVGGAAESVALARDITALTNQVTSTNSAVSQVNASVVALSGMISQTNAGVSQVNASVQSGQGALGSRVDGVDLALIGATQSRAALNSTALGIQSNVSLLQAQLRSANAQIAGLVSSINAIADCSGTTCVPRIAVCNLSSLGAGLSARGLSVTMPALVNGGAAVSVGGSLLFAPSAGFYLPSTAALAITCTGHGWNGVVPTPARCIANCAVCSGPTGCSMCSSGYVVNVTAPFARLALTGAQVTIDPRGPQANRQRPPNAANLAIGKNNLVDGTPNAGLWYTVVSYENRVCTDPAWVQVDLGSQMRVGSVQTWMYWLDTRRYCGQRVAVSQTGAFTGEEIEIYSTPGTDYGHAERPAGNLIYANGVTGRYIRWWSARSNVNVGTHFIEMRVFAAPLIAAHNAVCSRTT